MTNIEILEKVGIDHKALKSEKPLLLFNILKAMDVSRLDQQQVNSVDLADVVGQSEQLKPNGSYYVECECGNMVHARKKSCSKCGL